MMTALMELSTKQQELIQTFKGLLDQYGIRLRIDVDGAGINYPVSVDVEHDEQGNMVCIGIYDRLTHEAHIYTKVTDFVKETLEKASIIAHNGLGDLECLRSWGINVKDEQLIHDTMLFGHILDSSVKGFGLKDMAKRELGIEYPSYDYIVGKRGLKAERITLDKQPPEITYPYNAMDCYATYTLYAKQVLYYTPAVPKPTKSSSEVYFETLEQPVSRVFYDMECRGIRVELAYLNTLKTDLETQKAPLEAEIRNELGNINLDSPKQLLEALKSKGIEPTFKGKPSCDQRGTLYSKYGSNGLVKALKQASELSTLLSSFVYPYLERNTEVVHPFFNQCGTRTGRPSCSNPNLLQIPKRTENGKRVRRMFIAREGMELGDCDYSAIEPRVLAHLSKDENMLRLFNEGQNFHEFTQQRMGFALDEAGYSRAKVLNLSVGYRATKFSVQRQLGGTLDEAQKEIDKWWDLFPGLRRWQERLIFDAKKSGFCTTLLGRRIKVDRLNINNPFTKEKAERQLINNIAQGSAAEIMKKAMISITDKPNGFATNFGLLVQVYDELLFESSSIEHDKDNVAWCMENAVKLDIPLVVECKTGMSWGEVK